VIVISVQCRLDHLSHQPQKEHGWRQSLLPQRRRMRVPPGPARKHLPAEVYRIWVGIPTRSWQFVPSEFGIPCPDSGDDQDLAKLNGIARHPHIQRANGPLLFDGGSVRRRRPKSPIPCDARSPSSKSPSSKSAASRHQPPTASQVTGSRTAQRVLGPPRSCRAPRSA